MDRHWLHVPTSVWWAMELSAVFNAKVDLGSEVDSLLPQIRTIFGFLERDHFRKTSLYSALLATLSRQSTELSNNFTQFYIRWTLSLLCAPRVVSVT